MQPEYKNWTLADIEEALNEGNQEGKKIVVPKFQRNLVWSDEQKKKFIDSVKNGYPIGTLLLYNKEGSNQYSLIDGLQRSTTIKDFIENPTFYFELGDIPNDILENLYELFQANIDKEQFKSNVSGAIRYFIRNSKLDDMNLVMKLSQKLIEEFSTVSNMETLTNAVDVITPCVQEFKKSYDDMAKANIAAIVYQGDESNLPTIFERINNQGTQLGKYQIYAASWAVKNYTITVQNEKILKFVLDKYDAFIAEGYEIQDYDRDELESSKVISIFEYAMGFGKYIANEFPSLFESDKSVQDINPIGFELLNACFGRHDKDIKVLHERLHDVTDINLFEKRVVECIADVRDILNPIIGFKGNKRTAQPIYHSHYQIVSIIASLFREKYDINDLSECKADWQDKETILKKTLPQHFVFDILTKTWGDSGQGKVYSILNENKYLSTIDKEQWEANFSVWFSDSLNRREKSNIATAKGMEKLFLICIYKVKFSAQDQLSSDKFDIEHLATKDQMKKAIKNHNWEGLPISCIGNLCYLPEYDNRKKKNNTLYQDQAYLDYLHDKGTNISGIEDKYSFTKEADMDWLNKQYSDGDYNIFLANYVKFAQTRFDRMKNLFYDSLGIQ